MMTVEFSKLWANSINLKLKNMAQGFALGNILKVIPVDLVAKTPAVNFDSSGDFIDESGFFIRSDASGIIKYCPLNNKSDVEAIVKTIDVSVYFCDPEICRKIFHTGTTATGIYVGYGV
jgi:hypothetical protein